MRIRPEKRGPAREVGGVLGPGAEIAEAQGQGGGHLGLWGHGFRPDSSNSARVRPRKFHPRPLLLFQCYQREVWGNNTANNTTIGRLQTGSLFQQNITKRWVVKFMKRKVFPT